MHRCSNKIDRMQACVIVIRDEKKREGMTQRNINKYFAKQSSLLRGFLYQERSGVVEFIL